MVPTYDINLVRSQQSPCRHFKIPLYINGKFLVQLGLPSILHYTTTKHAEAKQRRLTLGGRVYPSTGVVSDSGIEHN